VLPVPPHEIRNVHELHHRSVQLRTPAKAKRVVNHSWHPAEIPR
jgi:hypothetical protein